MKSKKEIVDNWLPRYTGESLNNFGEYILLTNFSFYVTLFAKWNKVKVVGVDKPMPMQRQTESPLLILEWEVQTQQP